MINYSQANDRIDIWSEKVKGELRSEIDSQGIRHEKRSDSPRAAKDSLTKTLRKNQGLVERVSYRIPRHMIYVHKGVGRGTPIEKAGTTKRKAKPWFNPVIERNIEELGDIVAEELGSAIVNNLLIR